MLSLPMYWHRLSKEEETMAIRSIDILNVLAFRRQWHQNNDDPKTASIQQGDHVSEGFHLDFCDGINVLIGGNGVGKTSLLKMIYAATQWSFQQTDPGKTRKLLQFFSEPLKDHDVMKSTGCEDDYSYFRVSDGTHQFEYSLSHGGIFDYNNWLGLNIPSVFIPTTEMLSHSKGFLAMNQKYNMPFDGTQVDIIVNASLPETKDVSKTMTDVLQKLSQTIQGTVIQNDDVFYIQKEDGRKVDFFLEAEGYRKLGLLWKLIRNGLLESGSVLLWDGPEANLNPELYPVLVDALLELQRHGVQMFIATHSYNFAKYLEIRREKPEEVLFHNLYRGSTERPENMQRIFPEAPNGQAIYSETAERLDELAFNHIMNADERLLNEVYDMRGDARP